MQKAKTGKNRSKGNSTNNISNKGIFGIHHVTAITSDPQRNIDFYANYLGLRFVKLTVNQDDPTSYHLYYGDELGRPGTILTFFHWPDAPRGHRGTSEVIAISFLIPENSINYWIDRLKSKQTEFRGPYKRFDDSEQVITLHDPDGLELELVAHKSAEGRSANLWKEGPIPIEHAIRGFYSVTLSEEGYERTASVLTDELGFIPTRNDGSRFRYEIATTAAETSAVTQEEEEEQQEIEEIRGGGRANIVDVLCLPYTQQAVIGIGSVHHVAWRTPTDEQQKILRHNIVRAGLNATPVIDRFYFHSVYFREPGGILFEIATNPPGFAIDEKAENLGTRLVLAPWLESMRKDLEKVLPRVYLPKKEKERGEQVVKKQFSKEEEK
ncbi:MAG TPA: ring-cleaving dioxygenase [Nitrososphaeraceae archaeon]|nr:ring-cleaving dioxygenase [Nitrososphaeraceae archaeon]